MTDPTASSAKNSKWEADHSLQELIAWLSSGPPSAELTDEEINGEVRAVRAEMRRKRLEGGSAE